MATRKRPEWARRTLVALERAGLSERDLVRIAGAKQSKICRWLDGDETQSFSGIKALVAVSDATGASLHWIMTGEATNALQDKAQISRIRASVCRNPIVDFEMARAVMRRDDLEAWS